MFTRTLLTFSVLAGLAVPVAAEIPAAVSEEADPVKKGLAIALESEKRNDGFIDSESDMRMILVNAQGDRVEREMRNKVLENPDPDDGDKSIIVFDKPRDVKGTIMLTYAHHLEQDDQWMYMPALAKPLRRISSANKSGPFMGSEFANEDLAGTEVRKYSYNYLRDEPCGVDGAEERTCHVSERFPLYKRSGYKRQIVWTDTVDYQPRKIEYYDRRDSLLKTMTMTDYRLLNEKFWRAHRFYMENHKTKKATELLWTKIELGVGLKESEFNKNRLASVR